jgi:catechol 2,3-dioxygenase-like lactoylglutathione lyase family enzyme
MTTHQASFGATAFVPVRDQDRALAFYADTLGFERGIDFSYADGERWVEVLPPGGGVALALVAERDGATAGVEMRIALQTDDLEADYARYRQAGVHVDPILREGDPPQRWAGALLGGTPPMFVLRDPDGNSFVVVQRP